MVLKDCVACSETMSVITRLFLPLIHLPLQFYKQPIPRPLVCQLKLKIKSLHLKSISIPLEPKCYFLTVFLLISVALRVINQIFVDFCRLGKGNSINGQENWFQQCYLLFGFLLWVSLKWFFHMRNITLGMPSDAELCKFCNNLKINEIFCCSNNRIVKVFHGK